MTTSLHDGEVRLYDSCFHGHKLSASIEEQLVCIYITSVRDRVLPVTVMPVQQQTGSVDCEVFRQDHICPRRDAPPSCAVLSSKKKLLPFPGESKKVHRCRKKHLFIPVYCICGLPESYDSDMISCDQCGQWFHFGCMHIQTPPPETWFCSDCT